MGNCLIPCKLKKDVEQIPQNENLKKMDKEIENNSTEFAKESKPKRDGVRVKIVLTKEQLNLFLFQVKNDGGKSLDDVLGNIRAARDQKASGWTPSLESIMECPDV